jgi:leucyl aminopeptidase
MSLKVALVALAAGAQLGLAASSVPDTTKLRLVKTSEEDPGQWVTPEEKFERFTSKGIGFIDITDIKEQRVLKALSTKPEDRVTVHAVDFPTELSHVEEANGLIGSASTAEPQAWVEHLSSYHTRHSDSPTGAEAAAWLFETVQGIASANSAITVEQYEHSFDQPSVIARIPGTTDDLVIIGAHYDSTTGSATSRAPGADDNASGTVVVLETLRVLAEAGFAPTNTLEFHLYGGEEQGLLGSADIFADYASRGASVISYLNQDMAGYSPSGTPCLITDYSDPALNDYVSLIITEYTGKAPNTDTCGYGCSDHASADANGFPAAFPFEDLTDQTSPDIHTPNDTPDTIMWDAIERHIQLSIGYVVEASYLS